MIAVSPQVAKLVGLLLAGAFVVAAQYFPGVAWMFYVLAGAAGGKELLARTGDVPVSLLNEKT